MRKTLSNLKKLFTRRIIVKVFLIMTLGLLGWQFANLLKDIATRQFPIDDFAEYWAAARLHLTGGNPYSPKQMMAMQKSIGWQHDMPVI